jgi:hypothetical protein
VRDVQVTLQNVYHPGRTRMGRDWPVKPTIRPEALILDSQTGLRLRSWEQDTHQSGRMLNWFTL